MRLIRNPNRKRKLAGRIPITCYCYMQETPDEICDMCHIFNMGTHDVCSCGVWLKNSHFARCDECTIYLQSQNIKLLKSIHSRRNKRRNIRHR